MYNSFVLCTRTTICSHLPVLQNSDSLLEGLVIDRDRTKISNIVQSSPLPQLATESGGTSTPPTETQTRDCYRRIPRTKPGPRIADLLVTHRTRGYHRRLEQNRKQKSLSSFSDPHHVFQSRSPECHSSQSTGQDARTLQRETRNLPGFSNPNESISSDQ